MPYDYAYDPTIRKWVVFKKGDRKDVKGKHPNRPSALAQLRALYASEDKAKKPS